MDFIDLKDSDKDMDYSKLFTNMMSEGFIVIDNEGIIRLYNDSAKDIFGLNNKSSIYHRAGKIARGDLVIIGNNSMGEDDGGMDFSSLENLGLARGDIRPKEAFILISEFGGKNISYAVRRNHEDRLELRDRVKDIDINSYIDFDEKEISLGVSGQTYKLKYINAIGNMVILDGKTGELKFYQANGYTARKESINDILKGEPFIEKGGDIKSLNVIGRNIFDIHRSESIIKEFYDVAKGRNMTYKDKYEEINGYPTLCTLKPVNKDGKRIGAALKVEDISKLQKVINERDRILKKLEETSKEIKEKRELQKAFPNFIGEDEKIVQVKRLGLRASKTLSPVLLIGDGGVGKSLLAKIIHKNSRLMEAGFIHINCRTIGNDELSSVLEGARGSIYLEEVSHLDPQGQEAILSFIKESELRTDLRIIASSSQSLDEKILEGKFNEDLYYKINILPIFIPGLKERKEDISLLVDYFLPILSKRANTQVKRISKEALDLLITYNWSNNVRELISVLERAINLSIGNNILTKHIVLLEDMNQVTRKAKSLKDQLEDREKLIIQTSLSLYKGDKQKAMEELKVSKSTFYEKLKKYKIK